MERTYLRGVGVFPFASEQELIDYVERRPGILVAVNAEKIIHADDELRGLINRNIGYCDGAGAVKGLRKKGHGDVSKIAGCELWLKIIERMYRERTFYLVGGRQEVIDQTVEKLRSQFDGIRIVGYRNGYIADDEQCEALLDDIARKSPDVVFVAMGSPRQERLMERMQQRHKAIYQGLGGSFDVYTGHVERAPKWWIDHNMEFAYRLIKEPRRIKRQIHLVKYAYWLAFNKL
ncbi:WecB/TagA/CpsF family glycosyltransferase [uncultured Alistipes sp.]|uniref:WecB/TagA/CpsF family glycosyltransferase n=1 Tax=uncultured Alistipes sp. TaxID=538949 RepID=UPI0026590327|nr:WecB/TagA/CpsF family glycosyltransferase [uncultured Alistipes sp.]